MPPHQRRFTGFEGKILSLYGRGITTREIQGHLEEIYGVEVPQSLISAVTEGVIEEAKEWRGRPPKPQDPIPFLDALIVKMRHEGRVENRAVYIALGYEDDTIRILEWLQECEAAGAAVEAFHVPERRVLRQALLLSG